jgi:hypothetical protein
MSLILYRFFSQVFIDTTQTTSPSPCHSSTQTPAPRTVPISSIACFIRHHNSWFNCRHQASCLHPYFVSCLCISSEETRVGRVVVPILDTRTVLDTGIEQQELKTGKKKKRQASRWLPGQWYPRHAITPPTTEEDIAVRSIHHTSHCPSDGTPFPRTTLASAT